MGSYRYSRNTIIRESQDDRLMLFCSDVHLPHQSPAWDVMLKVAKAIKPDIVYLGGDILDFGAVSNHATKLVDRTLLKSDLMASRRELARLRKALPNAQTIFRAGNHEARLEAFLEKHAPELSMLDELSLPNLLRFESLDIEYVAHGAKEFFGHLAILHGDEVDGSSAKAKFSKIQTSYLCGHHHRFDAHYSKDLRGNTRAGFFNGCLYDPNHADYLAHESWQLGFSLVHFVRGFFEVRQIPVHQQDGSYFCLVNGRYYEETEREVT